MGAMSASKAKTITPVADCYAFLAYSTRPNTRLEFMIHFQ